MKKHIHYEYYAPKPARSILISIVNSPRNLLVPSVKLDAQITVLLDHTYNPIYNIDKAYMVRIT